jgi:glutamyl/glutaminyl-tRNA synthetase
MTRVRFAPSPTGSLHLGNALTAVANRRFADEHRGVLLLRIDDTDASRTVEGGEEAIVEDLAWLGVAFEEGPVRQSERTELYAAAADRALESGSARRDDDGAVRMAASGTTLLRPDGTATYQLASVVDDLDLAVTHVLRGSDHRPNLAVQTRIASALGRRLPVVIHHGLLLGPDGRKLS